MTNIYPQILNAFVLIHHIKASAGLYVRKTITICKQGLNPCRATAVLSFKPNVGQITGFHRSQLLRPLFCQCHNEPGSLVLLDSTPWEGVGSPVKNFDLCVWFCQCEVKRRCQGGECVLFAHVQTCRMDDTDGISLRLTFLRTLCLCVWTDMETLARLNRHLTEWRRGLRLSPESCMNRGCERLAEKVGGSVEIRSV